MAMECESIFEIVGFNKFETIHEIGLFLFFPD